MQVLPSALLLPSLLRSDVAHLLPLATSAPYNCCLQCADKDNGKILSENKANTFWICKNGHKP
jgi:hypothetical protein